MHYNELTPTQQSEACRDIWRDLTGKADSDQIQIAYSGMSVEEAIRTQTSGQLQHGLGGWEFTTPGDFDQIFNLVEYPPGPSDFYEGDDDDETEDEEE